MLLPSGLETGVEHRLIFAGMTRRPAPLRSPFRDAIIFMGLFVFMFLIVRFDIRRFGASGRDPHSSATSALVALVVAIIGTVYVRIKSR